jgi:hypothetical protein
VVQSRVPVRIEESAGEKGSIRSESEDKSDDSENSNEEDDDSSGKLSPAAMHVVETKTKPLEDDEEEDITTGHADSAVPKEVEVCSCKTGRLCNPLCR